MSTVTDSLITELRWQGADTYMATIRHITSATSQMSDTEQKAATAREMAAQKTAQAWQAQMGVYQNMAQQHQRNAIAAGVVAAAIIGIGTASVQAASEIEQSRIAFGTLTGSEAKGNKMLDDLREFARVTPFQFKDMPPMAQRMMAMGTPQESIIESMRTIGDAASAMGGGIGLVDRMTLALGQMRNSARLNAQDMNQLVQGGIPAWKMLADAMGLTVSQARAMSEAGQISGLQGYNTLMAAMKNTYGGAMEAQMQSAAGKLSNLADQLNYVKVNLGEALLPTIKNVTEALTTLASAGAALPKWLNEAGASVTVIGGLGAVIWGASHATQAWALNTQVNLMQQQLLTAELRRQNLVINQNRAGAFATGAMKYGGAALIGGAAGYTIAGMGGGAMHWGTGQGIGAWAGAGAAGALAGSMFGPGGAAIGGLAGFTAAVIRATMELDKLKVTSNEEASKAEGQYPMSFIASAAVPNLMQGNAWKSTPLREDIMMGAMNGRQVEGGWLVPTANIPVTNKQAMEKFGGGTWNWDKFKGDEAGAYGNTNTASWAEWRRNAVTPYLPSRTPAPGPSEAAVTAVDAAKAQAAAKGGLALATSYLDTTDLTPALWSGYLAMYDEAIAKTGALASAQERAGESDKALATSIEYNNLVKEKQNAITARQVEAQKALAAAYDAVASALKGAMGDTSTYMGMLDKMGAKPGSPLQREAAQQLWGASKAQAEFGMYSGDYGEYAAGVQGMLGAEDAWQPEGASKLGRPKWAMKPENVMSPWAFAGAINKAGTREAMNANVQVWVQTPNGWLQAQLAGVNAYMQRQAMFAGQ